MSSKSMIEKDDLNTLHKKAAKYKKNIKTLNLVLKKIKNIVDYPAQHEIKTELDHLGKLYCQTKQQIYYKTPKRPASRCLYNSPDLVGRMVEIIRIGSLDFYGIKVGDMGYVRDSSERYHGYLIVEFPDRAGKLNNTFGEIKDAKFDFLFVPKCDLKFVEE